MPQKVQKVKSGVQWLNFVLFVVLIIAIVGIAFFVYLKSENIDIRSIDMKQILKGNFEIIARQSADKKESTPEIKYDSKEKSVFHTYKEWLIKCTRDGISALDKTGEEQWKVQFSMNNPVIKVAGAYLMVYDNGGRDIFVLDGKYVKWSKRVDTNLVNADINQAGYIACVREMKGYKSAVTVFNQQGGETFTRNIAESFVLLAKVSPKAHHVLISSVNASGVNTKSSFEFTDIFGKFLGGEILQQEELFPTLWILNNETAFAVGDTSILYIDKNRQKKLVQQFAGRRIYSSGLLQDKYIAVAVSAEDKPGVFSGSSELKIFSAEGKQLASGSVDAEIKSMQVNGDLLALNTGREVHFFNSRAKEIGKYTSKSDILGVYFLNRQEAAVINKSSVAFTSVGD